MMSINGMISIRARLCGTGEASLILRNLVRRAGHGESDGNVNLGNCSRSKSPLPKRAGGGVIQYGTPGALRDRTASDVAASCIHLGDDHSTTSDVSRAKALALYAPRPQYPYEARSRHVTGSGVIVATVDAASGNVTSATVSSSTGSPILDNAATSAFRQWRFRPGTVSKVNIPITFTMTGASY